MVISSIVSDIAGIAHNSQYSSTKRQLDELESSVLEEEAFSMTWDFLWVRFYFLHAHLFRILPINEKCPLSKVEHDMAELSVNIFKTLVECFIIMAHDAELNIPQLSETAGY